jgi:hypothetical protein
VTRPRIRPTPPRQRLTNIRIEDFQWILREIVAGGGDASICRSTFVDGLTDGEIERLFYEARSRDYDEITADARATLKTLRASRRPTPERRAAAEDAVSKLRRRFAVVARIDFFGTENRSATSETLDEIEARLRPPAGKAPAPTRHLERDELRGRTWVTRQGIFVDRIASAWLIRRFIDPGAGGGASAAGGAPHPARAHRGGRPADAPGLPSPGESGRPPGSSDPAARPGAGPSTRTSSS